MIYYCKRKNEQVGTGKARRYCGGKKCRHLVYYSNLGALRRGGLKSEMTQGMGVVEQLIDLQQKANKIFINGEEYIKK